MSTLEKLNWRYATKFFDTSQKLSDEKLHILLETLRLSTSSFGVQPWKFVVVNNPQIRQDLKKHSWDQPQVVDASHLLVLCGLKNMNDEHLAKYMSSIRDTRHQTPESTVGFEKTIKAFLAKKDSVAMQKWVREQVYIALGSLLTVCAFESIDACPMEGFVSSEYDRILGLNAKGLESVVVVPVGYRLASDKYSQLKKVRFPLHEVIDYVE